MHSLLYRVSVMAAVGTGIAGDNDEDMLGEAEVSGLKDEFIAALGVGGVPAQGMTVLPSQLAAAQEVALQVDQEDQRVKARRLLEQQPPGAPVDPMQALARMLDTKFAEQRDSMQGLISQEVGVAVKPLKEEVAKNTSELGTVKAVQASQQRQIDALQTALKGGSGPPSATTGSTGEPPRRFLQRGRGEFGPGARRPDFTPQFITIQGWAQGANKDLQVRSQRMLNEAAGQRCLAHLFQVAKCLDQVDVDRTNQENTGKPCGLYRLRVYFKPTVTGNDLYALRKKWLECFTNRAAFDLETDNDQHKMIYANRTSILVECSPWKQPYVSAAGRFKACFYKHSTIPDGCVTVERYGPPTNFLWAYPTSDFKDGACVASFGEDRDQQWELNDAAMMKIDLGFLLEEFKAALHSY